MTKYVRQGSMYVPTPNTALDVHPKLPPGTYIIVMPGPGMFAFDEVESFKLPKKLYGDTTANADRILRTFADRPNGTGVMLNGEKGSGKTLLAKTLAIKAAKMGVPTILINAEWHGDGFNKLIQSIDQPAILIFDEFEKVYESETQEEILTLLDGVFPTKKLFVFTCNDKWKVNQHMRNRPGRVFYYLEYKGLGVEFVREYCEDNLNNKDHIDGVCILSHLYDHFNFDMLTAIVEEMNRYNENAQDATRILNARPEFSSKQMFKVDLRVGGEKPHLLFNPIVNYNPFDTSGFILEFQMKKGIRQNHKAIHVKFKNLKKVDPDKGTFYYEIEDQNARVELSRHYETTTSYTDLL